MPPCDVVWNTISVPSELHLVSILVLVDAALRRVWHHDTRYVPKNPCFNPCFSGCRPATAHLCTVWLGPLLVSILVLVDAALRRVFSISSLLGSFLVSILVLVDAALRQYRTEFIQL